jgi:hypothetical protein
MAAEQWVVTYRGYPSEDLLREQADLRAKKTLYSSQNMGNQGGTFSLDELRDQLYAIQLVLNERQSQHRGGQSGTFDYRFMEL